MISIRRWNTVPRTMATVLLIALTAATATAQESTPQTQWPPAIPGADENGVITLSDENFIQIPDYVTKALEEVDFEFTVAETPPTVQLVYHHTLPDPGIGPDNSTGWTMWGDILVASDGTVYSATGDHGTTGTRTEPGEPSDANVFIYRWHPDRGELERVCDPNAVVNADEDDPNWSKVHAGIHEGADGKIYFTPTFNDGQRAGDPEQEEPTVRWTDNVPTGQIFQYDPETGETQVVGLLPPQSATATSELDRQRNIIYYNLEGEHRNALFAFDLNSMQPIFQGPDRMIDPNRNMAMGRDGAIYYNASEGGIGKYDRETQQLTHTGLTIPGNRAMRSSTRQSEDGWIYATTHGGEGPAQLFRFNPEQRELELLGPDFLSIGRRNGNAGLGNYTTVSVLSPDEKYVYYLPGAHGGAVRIGTPVVQYEIETGTKKVLAFLRPVLEEKAEYVPGGTYGIKLSPDGSTLYVDFNGHAVEAHRLERMRPNGFGLTAFAAIHIPDSER